MIGHFHKTIDTFFVPDESHICRIFELFACSVGADHLHGFDFCPEGFCFAVNDNLFLSQELINVVDDTFKGVTVSGSLESSGPQFCVELEMFLCAVIPGGKCGLCLFQQFFHLIHNCKRRKDIAIFLFGRNFDISLFQQLLELEQDGNAELTAEEKDKFSTLFGVNWDNPELNMEDPQALGQYQNSGAPQIMVRDLLDYDRSEAIDEFAWRNIRNFLSYNLGGVSKPVIAQAFSEEVGFLHEGLLQIVLSEVRPAGYSPMELRLYEGGIFRLWQPSGVKNKDDVPSFETHGTLLWSIPVVEVILQPLKLKGNK